MKSKKNQITELNYTIEALEDEIEYLREDSVDSRAKLWEIIQENDILTMKYCPYRPPGDEDEDIDYYDLKEENNNLRLQLTQLAERFYNQPKPAEKKRNPKAGCVSFDFWPISDWFRLSYHRWSPGQASQLCIGPIRFDWFAS